MPASLSFTISCSFAQTHVPISSSSLTPFSYRQSFPASGSFPMSWLFVSGCQSIGPSDSASILLMNIQGWLPVVFTGLISLQSKGLLQESSPAPQFKSVSSLVLSLLYGPTLTSVRDYWKNHSFDSTDLCQQSELPYDLAIHSWIYIWKKWKH